MKKTAFFTVSILNLVLLPSFTIVASCKETKIAQTLRIVDSKRMTGSTENTNNSTDISEVSIDTSTIHKEDKTDASRYSDEQEHVLQNSQEDLQQASTPVNDSSDDLDEKNSEQVAEEVMIVQNKTTVEFIKAIGEQARRIAYEHDLYASVMIAQAILESGAGNSSLSIAPYYNLFGIKGDYKGGAVVMSTQEDDGKGNLFMIDSRFRHYPSYSESLKDYAQLLKEGIEGHPDFYKGTWKSETNDFREATAFLTGKYATDTQYAEKLNQLIDSYELSCYDEDQNGKTTEVKTNVINEPQVNKQVKKIIEFREIRKQISDKLKERQIQTRKKQVGQFISEASYYFVEILKWCKL